MQMDDDLISCLPNDILCHILSFLSTEDAYTTSLLSKRWTSLWLSLPNIDLDELRCILEDKPDLFFPSLVYAAIFKRSVYQPIKKISLLVLRLKYDIETWLTGAAERKLEHLEIKMLRPTHMLSGIFSLRNLVVLKLTSFIISTFSHVDFPSLKTLYLANVNFGHRWYFFELLNGCPILEDFEAYDIAMGNLSSSPDKVLKCLPKLVRAYFTKISNFPFQPFCSVQSLRFEEGMCCIDLFLTLNNLTQLELSVDYSWKFLVKVLNHCPKLQKLVLDKHSLCKRSWLRKDVKENWVDPNFVPQCLSSHLRTCNLHNFFGALKGEILFARYIIENAKFLQTMRVWSIGEPEINRKLSGPQASATCKIGVTNVGRRWKF